MACARTLAVLLLAAGALAPPAAGHGVMVQPPSRNWLAYMSSKEYNPHSLSVGGERAAGGRAQLACAPGGNSCNASGAAPPACTHRPGLHLPPHTPGPAPRRPPGVRRRPPALPRGPPVVLRRRIQRGEVGPPRRSGDHLRPGPGHQRGRGRRGAAHGPHDDAGAGAGPARLARGALRGAGRGPAQWRGGPSWAGGAPTPTPRPPGPPMPAPRSARSTRSRARASAKTSICAPPAGRAASSPGSSRASKTGRAATGGATGRATVRKSGRAGGRGARSGPAAGPPPRARLHAH